MSKDEKSSAEKADAGAGASEVKSEAGEPSPEGQVAAAESEPVDSVDDLKQQLEGMSDRYLRLMAEFDNFKKRVSRDYERLVDSANEKLILELIGVRESFERALKSGENATDVKPVYDGTKLIYGQFDDVLSKSGLEVFGTSGDQFDPLVHDALMKLPSATVPEDHVVEVYERGYRLKGRVIKHAKVVVSSGKA